MSDLPPPDANGWRPIESAPKHEVIVLTDGGYYIAGFWNRVMALHLSPTHWRPLPKGPVS